MYILLQIRSMNLKIRYFKNMDWKSVILQPEVLILMMKIAVVQGWNSTGTWDTAAQPIRQQGFENSNVIVSKILNMIKSKHKLWQNLIEIDFDYFRDQGHFYLMPVAVLKVEWVETILSINHIYLNKNVPLLPLFFCIRIGLFSRFFISTHD